MTHFEAVEVIASHLTNQIVISNVGNTNRELYSVKKHKLTLYGVNMSLVTPLAFGLAKAIPQRKIIALDGDGSILMGLKTLATVGTHPAKNLLVLGSRQRLLRGVWMVSDRRRTGCRSGGNRHRYRIQERESGQ